MGLSLFLQRSAQDRLAATRVVVCVYMCVHHSLLMLPVELTFKLNGLLLLM